MSEEKQRILVVIQHTNDTCLDNNFSVLTAANQFAQYANKCSIDVLIIGHQVQPVVDKLSHRGGIDRVLVVDDPEFEHWLSDRVAAQIVPHADVYSHMLTAASTTGKDLFPRIAALLDVGQLSDIIAVESIDTVTRPIYAGNALAKVQSTDRIKVVTVRESAFDSYIGEGVNLPERVDINPISVSSDSEFVSQEVTVSERPELSSASVVVSGGRGVGSQQNFLLIEQLADKLGGAIGASRAAVDAGYVPNDMQVGQTGKIVAPDLYIAVGISGAIQHVAGMKGSKVIVAINSDPQAPIFDVADYGLVGDLFTVLPDLLAKLD